MNNFKGFKVQVLKHEMHNDIVLIASAVGWTLQEKNERKSLAIPHQGMLSILLTASILSPVGICCSPGKFSLMGTGPAVCSGLGDAPSAVCSCFRCQELPVLGAPKENLGFPWLAWASLCGTFLCIKASSKDGAQQWSFFLPDFNGISFVSWRPESFLWYIFRPFGINVCLSPCCQHCCLSWAGGCLSWDAGKEFVGVSRKLWGL